MMFYTQLFTSKRAPLAKIWLAAHWERKLTKAHVFECNLETTIKHITSPKMKIGLRISGHLLLGVVRIFSRKTKYLLADCSDALVKIKVAFRPGPTLQVGLLFATSKPDRDAVAEKSLLMNHTDDQTDLPVESLEATEKAITLTEEFTAFDAPLPRLSDIDVSDNFTLNQGQTEEITLKEDFGNTFLNFSYVEEDMDQRSGLLDTTFQSLAAQGDMFGDEDKAYDLIDFLTDPGYPTDCGDFITKMPVIENPESLTLVYEQGADMVNVPDKRTSASETTLLRIEKQAFALEPVSITPSSGTKKKGKRKRKLLVDEKKELSNETIKEQLANFSDLVTPLDMAPPTRGLMQWKESGGAKRLLVEPCSTIVAPDIKELFSKFISQGKLSVCEKVEEMRCDDHKGARRDMSTESTSDVSTKQEETQSPELKGFDSISDTQNESLTQPECDDNKSQDKNLTHPELPSEDSMFVHPSVATLESNSAHTQSLPGSQSFEERRLVRRAQVLLHTLNNQSNTSFSLAALCEGSTRSQAAITLFHLLVLKKHQAVQLHQSRPYKDVLVTPGPAFSSL